MKRGYTNVILLVLGLLAGIAASKFIPSRTGGGNAPSTKTPISLHDTRKQREANTLGDEAKGIQSIGALLDRAFSEQSEIRATRHLMAALAQHNKESAPAFASYFSSLPFSKTRFHHWRLFFSSWGTFDGPAALAFIRKRFAQPALQKEFYHSVLKSWDREIPGDALRGAGDFLVATPGATGDLAQEFVRDLMASDREKGLSQMVRLSDPEAVLEMAGAQLGKQAAKDIRTALERLSGTEGEERLFLAGALLGVWSETDPNAAAAWLASEGYPAISRTDLNLIAGNYVKKDPAAAFAWVNGLPESLFSEDLVGNTAKAWAGSDPVAANSWLAAHKPAVEFDPVVIAIAQTFSTKHPADSLVAASTLIHDPAKSQETFFGMAMEWQRKSPAEFSSWIKETTLLRPEQKQRLLQREFHADNPSTGSSPTPPQQPLSDGRQ